MPATAHRAPRLQRLTPHRWPRHPSPARYSPGALPGQAVKKRPGRHRHPARARLRAGGDDHAVSEDGRSAALSVHAAALPVPRTPGSSRNRPGHPRRPSHRGGMVRRTAGPPAPLLPGGGTGAWAAVAAAAGLNRRGVAGLAGGPHRRGDRGRAHARVRRAVAPSPYARAHSAGVARNAHRAGRCSRRPARRRRGGRGRRGVAGHRRAGPPAGRPGGGAGPQRADHRSRIRGGSRERDPAAPVAGRGQPAQPRPGRHRPAARSPQAAPRPRAGLVRIVGGHDHRGDGAPVGARPRRWPSPTCCQRPARSPRQASARTCGRPPASCAPRPAGRSGSSTPSG